MVTMKLLLINELICQWARLWAQLHWYESVIAPQKAINLLVILTILIANRICCDMPKHLNLMTFKVLQRSWKHQCSSKLFIHTGINDPKPIRNNYEITMKFYKITTKFWEQRWKHQNNKRCFCLFSQINAIVLAYTDV